MSLLAWGMDNLPGVSFPDPDEPRDTSSDQVEIYNVSDLNAPTQDCLHTFPKYVAEKVGWVFYDASIFCAGSQAYIRFSRKSQLA